MTDFMVSLEDQIRTILEESEQKTPEQLAAGNVQGYLVGIERTFEEMELAIDRWSGTLLDAASFVPTDPVLGGIGMLHNAERLINTFGGNVDIPNIDILLGSIRNAISATRAQIRDINRDLSAYIEQPGRPERIKTVAQLWGDEVQNPISGMAGWFTEETLLVDNAWSGLSGQAYRDFCLPQHEAVKEVSSRAVNLRKQLMGMATALDQFWDQVPRLLNDGFEQVGQLAAGLTTPDVWGIDDKIVQFGIELSNQIDKAYQVVRDAEDKYQNAIDELLSALNDNTYFPSGAWPRSQALRGLTDDPSDWTATPVE